MSPPAPIAHVGVVVPARDEEERLDRCLEAIAVAADRVRSLAVTVSVTVVLDRCTDDTTGVAVRGGADVVTSTHGRVGAARADGVDSVLARVVVPLERVWIANTDADSRVHPDWLVDQVARADRGADLVLGTVRPDASDLGEAGRLLVERARSHVAIGQVYGANLGVRASAYRSLGGFAPVAAHEDATLVAQARCRGDVVIDEHDEAAVVTSSRLEGRAPHGYADFLASMLGD